MMDTTITETEVATSLDTDESASWGVETDVSSEATDYESEPVEGIFEIDGAPITVDEARSGYLRQADYTRKTQELAEQRRQLQNAEVLQAALQRDPQATIKAIADAYGVPLTNQAPAPAPQAASDFDDGWWGEDKSDTSAPASVNDPRLDELVQWRQQQEVAAAQARIQNELTTLHGQYGEFDQGEVLRFALDNGFPDVTAAFKALHFDRLQAEVSRRQEEQKRVQAKREAQVVSQGGSRTGASTAATPQGGMTIRDAWLAAKKEHGG
jgi:hypothetical protein